jgi:hypothetical protein
MNVWKCYSETHYFVQLTYTNKSDMCIREREREEGKGKEGGRGEGKGGEIELWCSNFSSLEEHSA